AIDADPDLEHDTRELSDADILRRIGATRSHPEGLFLPETYTFSPGASDLEIYRQAHALLERRLAQVWENRAPDLPLSDPYQALILASIVEKETGHHEDRSKVAAVFVNRLRAGMILQSDPTTIYGMGDRFDGNLRKRDLQADTAYNTYTRPGLPPTPIALPGMASIDAALHPADIRALYFVSRGDGTSEFSDDLASHNRAVARYQLGRK
ncbi:MAG: endolytic transglycosylase MltG, partial [Gammaproteobacteria bacterium]